MIKNGGEGKQELARLYNERRKLNKGTRLVETVYFRFNRRDSVFLCKEKTKKIFRTVRFDDHYSCDEECEEIWERLFYGV